jgi:hypothetical protein
MNVKTKEIENGQFVNGSKERGTNILVDGGWLGGRNDPLPLWLL